MKKQSLVQVAIAGLLFIALFRNTPTCLYLMHMLRWPGCSRQVQLGGEKLRQLGEGQRPLAERRGGEGAAHWLLHNRGYWVFQCRQFLIT